MILFLKVKNTVVYVCVCVRTCLEMETGTGFLLPLESSKGLFLLERDTVYFLTIPFVKY